MDIKKNVTMAKRVNQNAIAGKSTVVRGRPAMSWEARPWRNGLKP